VSTAAAARKDFSIVVAAWVGLGREDLGIELALSLSIRFDRKLLVELLLWFICYMDLHGPVARG
jgi:hypothetical protein